MKRNPAPGPSVDHTLEAYFVKNTASSHAESPPPTTTTIWSLNMGIAPSQTAQADIPRCQYVCRCGQDKSTRSLSHRGSCNRCQHCKHLAHAAACTPKGMGCTCQGGGGVGTRPQYLIVCLWRRLLASRHCSF